MPRATGVEMRSARIEEYSVPQMKGSAPNSPDTALEGGMVFAERLRARVEEHDFAEGGQPLHVTVSVGVAAFPADGLQVAEDVIAQADSALYRAKHEGRNMVRR